MSIRSSCPNCNRDYNVADADEGKRVRCKQCGETFVIALEVQSASDDDVRPRQRGATGRRKKKAAQSSSVLIWALVGGGVLLLLVIGLVVAIVIKKRGAGDAPVGGGGPRGELIGEVTAILEDATRIYSQTQNIAATDAMNQQLHGLSQRVRERAAKMRALPPILNPDDGLAYQAQRQRLAASNGRMVAAQLAMNQRIVSQVGSPDQLKQVSGASMGLMDAVVDFVNAVNGM